MGILGELSQMAASGRVDEMNKLLHKEAADQNTKSSDLHSNLSRAASAVKQQGHHNDASSFASIR